MHCFFFRANQEDLCTSLNPAIYASNLRDKYALPSSKLLVKIALIAIPILLHLQASATPQTSLQEEQIDTNKKANLTPIPAKIDRSNKDGNYYIHDRMGVKQPLVLNQFLTDGLSSFIKRHGNHMAAVVIIDVQSGDVIAIAQGRHPNTWGTSHHSTVFTGYPAASIFKTVPATALIDIYNLDPDKELPLWGGCSKVHANGLWLDNQQRGRRHVMTLERAFANSCNSFFAKVSITHLGLSVISKYAKKYNWGEAIPTDFALNPSPIHMPKANSSSIQTIGEFSAGFGPVGISPMHAAWIYYVIANNGLARPIRLFASTPPPSNTSNQRIFKFQTATILRSMMNRTIRNGTAASAFRKRGYRHLVKLVGGKTGTLTGSTPKGLTTWFTGVMPYEKPEIAVAAVVVTGSSWVIKGPHLAAEAFRLWYKYRRNQKLLSKKKSSTKKKI